MRDDLVQQLAETMQGAWDSAPAASWTDAARAVLASGLVVPTSDVLALAQQWEACPNPSVRWYGERCATELRALTQQGNR